MKVVGLVLELDAFVDELKAERDKKT